MSLRLVALLVVVLGGVLLGHVWSPPFAESAARTRHHAVARGLSHPHAETHADALFDDDDDSDDDDGLAAPQAESDDDAVPRDLAREARRERFAPTGRATPPWPHDLGPSSGHQRENEHPPRS